MEFLGDASNASAVDVIAFVREVVEKFPNLRSGIVDKLLQTFTEIKSGKVFRGAMWIVGEYAASREEVEEAMEKVRKVIGEIPILASEQVSLLFTPYRYLTILITVSFCSASSIKLNKKLKPRLQTKSMANLNSPKNLFPPLPLECSPTVPTPPRPSSPPLLPPHTQPTSKPSRLLLNLLFEP